MSEDLNVSVLGALEVRRGNRVIEVRGKRHRPILVALAAFGRHGCSAQMLLDLAWGEEQPLSGVKALRVEISSLRKLLADSGDVSPIATTVGGYRLISKGVQIDLETFVALATNAKALRVSNDHAQAGSLCAEALALWRGTALADLGTAPSVLAYRQRYEEIHREMSILELAVRSRSTPDDPALVPDLRRAISKDPYDEDLYVLLMKVLAERGRRADAIAAYDELRHVLVTGLGIEPGPTAQDQFQLTLRTETAIAPVARHPGLGDAPTSDNAADVHALVVAFGRGVDLHELQDIAGRDITRDLDELASRSLVVVLGGTVHLGPTLRPPLPSAVCEAHRRIAARLADSFEKEDATVILAIADHVASAGTPADHQWAQRAFTKAASTAASLGLGDVAAVNHRRRRTVSTTLAEQLDCAMAEAAALHVAGRSAHSLLLLDRVIEEAEAFGDQEIVGHAVLKACSIAERSVESETRYGLLRDRVILGLDGSTENADLDLRVRLRCEAAATKLLLGQGDDAAALAQRALADASVASPSTRIEALTGVHQAVWRADNLADRLGWANDAVEMATRGGAAIQLAHSHLLLTSDLLEAGLIDEFCLQASRAVVAADRAGLVRFRWASRTWLALAAELNGLSERAAAIEQEAREVWPNEMHPDAAFGAQAWSICRLLQVDPPQAVDLLYIALAERPDSSVTTLATAVGLALSGRSEAARGLLNQHPLLLQPGPAELAELAFAGELAIALEDEALARSVQHRTSGLSAHHFVANAHGAVGFYWGPVADLQRRLMHLL